MDPRTYEAVMAKIKANLEAVDHVLANEAAREIEREVRAANLPRMIGIAAVLQREIAKDASNAS